MWDAQHPLGDRYSLLLYDHRGSVNRRATGPYAVAELGADVIALLDGLGLDTVAFCGVSVAAWSGSGSPRTIRRVSARSSR